MPYDYDANRDLQRLIPLGMASVLVTLLVAAELIANGEIARDPDDVGPALAGIFFIVMILQSVALVALSVLLTGLHVFRIPLALRLPALLALSAAAGAAAFWWASPWTGAGCGLVTFGGWFYSVRDRLA